MLVKLSDLVYLFYFNFNFLLSLMIVFDSYDDYWLLLMIIVDWGLMIVFAWVLILSSLLFTVLVNMVCISIDDIFFFFVFNGKWKLILIKICIPSIPKESFGLSGTHRELYGWLSSKRRREGGKRSHFCTFLLIFFFVFPSLSYFFGGLLYFSFYLQAFISIFSFLLSFYLWIPFLLFFFFISLKRMSWDLLTSITCKIHSFSLFFLT